MSSALAKQRKRLKRTGMTDAQAEGIIKAINETSNPFCGGEANVDVEFMEVH